MSTHKRWATVPTVAIINSQTPPPTFNTVLAAKKADVGIVDHSVVVNTAPVAAVPDKARRDVQAELLKIANRKAKAKEKTSAPKAVKPKVEAKPAKASKPKVAPIKPAKTVKAPVVKKAAAKVTPMKKASAPKATKKKA